MYRLLYGSNTNKSEEQSENDGVNEFAKEIDETVSETGSTAKDYSTKIQSNSGLGGAEESGTAESSGRSDRCEKYNPWSGRSIDYQRSRDTIVRRIVELIGTTNRSSKFISSVVKKGDRIEFERIFNLFNGRCSNALFKWFVVHGDHIHIVHDCTYSNGSCRCFNKYPFDRRTRRIISSQSLSKEDYQLLVDYHFEAGRKAKGVSVGNIDYTRLFCGLENVRHEQDSTGRDRIERDVEVCDYTDEVLWEQLARRSNSRSGSESDYNDNKDNQEAPRRRKYRRTAQKENKEKQQVKLEKFIMAIGKVPLGDFVVTKDFLDSEWKFHNDMSVTFKNALRYAKYTFYNMQLRDYRDFYENLTILPYWDTSSRDQFHEKYLSLEMSKKFLYKLLIWQTNERDIMTDVDNGIVDVEKDWKTNFYAYVRNLIQFLDKKRGKLNTDLYVSPSCAGKTLFMDLIRDYLINCGQMLNWNRNSNFPLQMCGNTRCIFWNEPNYEQSVEKNLLKLLGGDSLNAQVKNQMDVNIEKTPIFVTSNNYPFPKSAEFNYRIQYYHWKAAPFLKKVNGKKLHPLSFQYLITDCENYYQEDITQYHEKYTVKEYNLLKQLNIYDLAAIADSTDNETDNENDTDNEMSNSSN
ncbi:nonstructural protein 1 [Haematobia irritans densovirus]|uniref:Nonstructural protein 1 n=2 Tax=root TaxID=1 RepID=A0A4D6V0I8_9VIRU|nr:nonstructural protein 1 [Haematobia irritans densovirus]QCH41361.1 nonstructural protein 1 [Haematobia irritans densovirus]